MNMKKTLFVFIIALLFVLICFKSYSNEAMRFSELEKGVYVMELDSSYFYKNSSVYLSGKLETVEQVAEKKGVKVAINGGFFDPNNEKTTSFLVIDGEIAADPGQNENLTGNPELSPYMDKILDRSEFRVLECCRSRKFDIASHFAPVEPECTLKYSLQAGPALVPSLRLTEEFFTLENYGKVVRQSASALQRVARSAIGIKADKIYLIAVDNEAGMTLQELAELVKRMGMEKAMALDGGSSTSLYVNLPEKKFSLASAGEGAGRKVKTVLLVK